MLELELTNTSDASFVLENLSEHTLINDANTLVVPPHSKDTYRLRVSQRSDTIALPVRVRNALTAPDVYAEMEFTVSP